MTLIFLRSLDLKLISGKQWMGLSLFFILRNLIAVLSIGVVFVFFNQRLIFFRAPGVDFPNHGIWLETGLYFSIDSLLYHFFPRVQVSSSIIYLSSNGGTETISKIGYQGFLVGDSDRIKLFQYSL